MYRTKLRSTALILTSFALPGAMLAQEASLPKIKLDLSLGSTSILAEEIVWNTEIGGSNSDEKLSLLEWDTLWTPTARLGASMDLNDRFSIHLSGDFATSGDSQMVDYDWLGEASSKSKNSWTERSKHPDTALDFYNSFDANLTYKLEFNEGQTQLSPLVGVNYTQLRWTAFGGSYVYSSNPNNSDKLRDRTGEFADGSAGISYQMTYLSPYIGANLSHSWQEYELSLGGKLGRTMCAETYDYHYVRNIRFVEDLDNTLYTSANLGFSQALTENLSIISEISWTGYQQTNGDTTIYNDDAKTSEFENNSSAASLQSYRFTIGAKYSF